MYSYKKKFEKICVYCGNTFMARYNHNKYCSMACSSNRNGNKKERLYKKTIRNGDCLEYTGFVSEFGYGQIRYKNRMIGAHRYAYIIEKGDIPEGMVICHKCDNRKCVNIDHLFLGTQKDNVQDMINKGRQVLMRGERNGKALLTDEEAREIFILYHGGGFNFCELERQYKVDRKCISHICKGKAYKAIDRTIDDYWIKNNPEFGVTGVKKVLTMDQVKDIRRLYNEGFKIAEINKIYKVDKSILSRVCANKIYK